MMIMMMTMMDVVVMLRKMMMMRRRKRIILRMMIQVKVFNVIQIALRHIIIRKYAIQHFIHRYGLVGMWYTIPALLNSFILMSQLQSVLVQTVLPMNQQHGRQHRQTQVISPNQEE